MSEKKAFEDNQVYLWGQIGASQNLLDIYDKGNKNPKSKAKPQKTVKNVEVKKTVKNRVYNSKEKYTIDDLDFLNKEYDRIEEEASNLTDFDKMDELVEIQDEIYNLIQKLEKDKYNKEEEEYKPVASSNDNFEQIKKLTLKLSELTDEYISSRGNKAIKEKMDAIEEKIERLGKQQKTTKPIKGSNIVISLKEEICPKIDDCEIIEKIIKMVGRGFKKGSPEAIAHAEKMRLAREAKKAPNNQIVPIVPEVQKNTNKARVQKGSEEAKALAKKLVEARKAKQEAKKKELEEEKRIESLKNPVKAKGRPYYYIGDIPKGYREATETEAISHNKVSKYGKYQIDTDKYFLWINYEILLDENKNQKEVIWTMNGLKRRILKSLEDIEIYSNKLSNDKYESKKEDFSNKLIFEKERRKYLQYGYDWYNKLLSKMKGIPYNRIKIELPVKEYIPSTESKIETKIESKPFKRPIDPRTGKEAKYSYYEGDEEEKDDKVKGDADVELYFKKDDDIIKLSTKYFNEDYKLKSKYVEKLKNKGIILAKKHYNTEDYNKHFYHMVGSGFYKLI